MLPRFKDVFSSHCKKRKDLDQELEEIRFITFKSRSIISAFATFNASSCRENAIEACN